MNHGQVVRGFAALFAAALSWVPATPALAHAGLAASSPADRTSLSQPPAAVWLRFTDPLDTGSVQVAITDATGADRSSAQPVVAGDTVTLTTPQLGLGRFTIAYRVVSSDGHPVSGTITFEVVEPATVPRSAAAGQPSRSAAVEPTTFTARLGSDDDSDRRSARTALVLVLASGLVLLIGTGVLTAVRRHRATAASQPED